jgi:hypothetical protein
MRAPRAALVASATAAGLVGGWMLAQRYLGTSPRRRHAAIGYLAGHPSPETVRLLRDYLAWERRPALRRRGLRVVRELERAL